MMITIKAWCLPSTSEDKLNDLHKAIVKAGVSISELGVKDENDMICLFPADLMKYGLGKEIIVEIDNVPDVPRKSLMVRIQLAPRVGERVLCLYPDARIECSAEEVKPSSGRWSSTEPNS